MQAILLVNLGSPDSPSVSDVRKYLDQFLMDRYVIDTPWLLRRFIVSHILKSRPEQSAHAYQSIWTKEGSPLVTISRSVQQKLEARFDGPVALGMRYGNPSIASALKEIAAAEDIIVVPLYPHYALSSVETAVQEVKDQAKKLHLQSRLTFLPPFYAHPRYISALVKSARASLTEDYDHLLFSYHGLPVRHVEGLGPDKDYRVHVQRTSELFVKEACIPKEKWSLSFQSRLGKDPWLRPFTDEVIVDLAGKGVRKLVVISPAFVSDCLETLEELGMRGRKSFLEAGGQEFRLIPCLNDHPAWIEALFSLIQSVQFLKEQMSQQKGGT
ncbi:MAG: ferrochelatase [Deltaproteobacteria bacterium]|nr:ferrochelatase [Deltaproteobacteria bacterium]